MGRAVILVFSMIAAALLGSGGTAIAAPAAPAAAPVASVVRPAAAPARVMPAHSAPARSAPARSAPAAAARLVRGTPCSVTARACIDLSARRAWLIRGGVVQYGPVPITSGRVGYRTPVGNFRVTFKDVDHLSREFGNAPMPNSVFFNGGIAFHQGSLRVTSHGCIHLSRAASRVFFASLAPGDVVQVRA